ncbi:MAG TPA: helix-turn-helix transcriptional regulator [Actinophytocola sp.]|uniref:helix-turn-helix domain-containing protein n=1 Tax=Actinophytocola sp. TaxID=1872138 RepID=UPI002DB6482E|nr:helix-turn-helix transcriptional regulator [Actinophytocola sp.]HEU5474232.1 helix-turn-helix transcriptional regulator [Actinophytocola sp.]
MTTIGERIRELRAGWMTQADLAAAADVSLSLIRKLEQGQRHTASIGSLHRIARALDVDLTALLNKPASMPSGDPNSGVVAIRNALTSVDSLLGEATGEGDPASLDEAARVVTYAWGSYWGGHLEALGTLLPIGLAQLRATARAVDSPTAYELLAQLYTVTRCTSTRLGQPDLAWLAIRNAVDAAGRGNDPLLAAMVRSSVAHQLLTQGRYDESLTVSMHAADGIEPSGDVPAAHLSAYGHLLLMAASAAGRNMQEDHAVDLLNTSMEYARRIGADRNDYETSFGVSQVTMQTVDVRVVTENYAEALNAADRLPKDTRLPVVSRARNLYDQALAHTRLGNDQRALDAVLAAEHMAPDMMRYHTLPRQVVAELMQRGKTRRLRDLARRLGVAN